MAKTKKPKMTPCAAPVKSTPSTLHIAFVGLLCLVAFLSPWQASSIYAMPILAVQALIFLTAVVWMMDAMKKGVLEVPGGLVMPLLGVFVLLAILSAVDTVCLHRTVREMANMFGYFLVFLMVASLREDKKSIYLVIASLLMSAMVVAGIGIYQYRTSPDPSWRVFSTFFNPDYLAGFMAIVLPVVAAWFLSRISLWISGLMIFIGVSILGTLFLTGSRFGAAAGFLGVLACFAWAFLSGIARTWS